MYIIFFLIGEFLLLLVLLFCYFNFRLSVICFPCFWYFRSHHHHVHWQKARCQWLSTDLGPWYSRSSLLMTFLTCNFLDHPAYFYFLFVYLFYCWSFHLPRCSPMSVCLSSHYTTEEHCFPILIVVYNVLLSFAFLCNRSLLLWLFRVFANRNITSEMSSKENSEFIMLFSFPICNPLWSTQQYCTMHRISALLIFIL